MESSWCVFPLDTVEPMPWGPEMSTSSPLSEHPRNFPFLTLLLGIICGYLLAILFPKTSFETLTIQLLARTNRSSFVKSAGNSSLQNYSNISSFDSSCLFVFRFTFADSEDVVAKVVEKHIRIFCWVLTHPKNHKERDEPLKVGFPTVRNFWATWLQRCTGYVFMSVEADDKLPAIKLNVSDGKQHLWEKVKQAWRYVHDHYVVRNKENISCQNDYDWFLRADDDTYIVMENLRYLLLPHRPEEPVYYGYWAGDFMSGIANALSREAVRKLVYQFD